MFDKVGRKFLAQLFYTMVLFTIIMKLDKKYLAEFIGTFALSIVVILSSMGQFPVPTPLLAALTVLLMVYTVGHVSGAHINPAVTIGLHVIKKIKPKEAAMYIIFQVAAAFSAMFVARIIGITSVPGIPYGINPGIAEAFGAFFFTFGIAAVVAGKVPSVMNGIVVGVSLLIGITIAALTGSAGILNPAVAISLRVFNVAYFLGPVVGSVLGMSVYQIFSRK